MNRLRVLITGFLTFVRFFKKTTMDRAALLKKNGQWRQDILHSHADESLKDRLYSSTAYRSALLYLIICVTQRYFQTGLHPLQASLDNAKQHLQGKNDDEFFDSWFLQFVITAEMDADFVQQHMEGALGAAAAATLYQCLCSSWLSVIEC